MTYCFKVMNFFSFMCLIAFLLFTQFSCDLVKGIEKINNKKIKKVGFNECLIADNMDTLHYYYFNSGKNKTLILLHGFGANALFQWKSTAIELSKYYNIVIPDLVFFGKSKSKSNDFSIEYQVNAINKILKSSRIFGKISILGNSYGGLVATIYAETYPERVEYLLLNNSLMKNFSIKIADLYAESKGEKSIFNLLAPSTISQLNKSLDIAYYKAPRIPKLFKKQFVKKNDENKQITNRKIFEYLLQNEELYKNRKYSFNDRTYFIWGSNDSLIPSELAKEIINEYKISFENLRIIKNSAHCPNLEKNKNFCLVVSQIVK